MSPDVIDVILIFAFVLCVLVLAIISVIPTALRNSYEAGRQYGILQERERRRSVEERVETAIEEAFQSPEWERELDV